MKIKIYLVSIILALSIFGLPSTRGQTLIDLSQLTEISADNVDQLQLLNTLETYSRLSFNGDGTLLAAGGVSSGSVKVWDVQTGSLINEIARPRHEEAFLFDLAFSPTSNLVAIAWNDGLNIWNLEDNTQQFVFQSERLTISDVTFSRDGTMLITSSFRASILVWETTTFTLIDILEHNLDTFDSGIEALPVMSTAMSSDNAFIAGAAANGYVILWGFVGGGFARLDVFTRDDVVRVVAFTSDNGLIAAGSAGIKIWDNHYSWDAPPVRELSGVYHVSSIALTLDETVLISNGYSSRDSSSDSIVQLWDLNTDELLLSLGEPAERVNNVLINPQGTIIAVSRGATVELWGIPSDS